MIEHVESGSFVVVKVFVPEKYSSNDILDVESMEVNLDGYLNEFKEQYKFSLSGAVDQKQYNNVSIESNSNSITTLKLIKLPLLGTLQK